MDVIKKGVVMKMRNGLLILCVMGGMSNVFAPTAKWATKMHDGRKQNMADVMVTQPAFNDTNYSRTQVYTVLNNLDIKAGEMDAYMNDDVDGPIRTSLDKQVLRELKK